MAQVKFYSVSTAPAANAPGGNLYFVNGGELYKGASRFGANKVWTVPSDATITGATAEAKLSAALTAAGVTGAIGGDILTGYGAAKVFNGTTWVDLGQDQAALTSQMKSLVSGLAFDGTTGSYITGITQDPDTGFVTAQVGDFGQTVKDTIGDGSSTSTANGITVSVVTTSGSVTNVSVEAANLEVTSISASSATFTDLTVTSTATFSVTSISATTLTVNGSTVNQIAQAEISAVTTNAVTSTGASLPTESAVYDFVTGQISSLGNAMHFVGLTSDADITQDATVAPDDITGYSAADMKAGDIVLKGTSEYIWNGSKWELIGDQGAYAANAYSSTANVYTAATATTVPLALNAVGAAIDTLTASASTFASQKAQIGKSSAALYGLEATISLYSGSAPTITLTGSSIATTSNQIGSDTNYLVTASAVYGFVDSKLTDNAWHSTSTSNANGVQVTATVSEDAVNKVEVGLAITAATTAADVSDSNKASNLVTAAAVSAYVAQEITSAISGLDAVVFNSNKGVFVSVAEEDGILTGMTVSVAAASEMNYGDTGSADELATTAAVATFFNNNLVWLGDSD